MGRASTAQEPVTADALWRAIAAAGPLSELPRFDPMVVDNPMAAERAMTQFDRRRAFVASFAWAVPTPEAIEAIVAAAGQRRILEVCAGSGLWARLLTDAGASVIATDASAGGPSPHFDVETLEAEAAVQRYSSCEALFLCWPPFKDRCAARALAAFRGDCVIYAGDERFTAERTFHDALAADWQVTQKLDLPSWPGTRDAVRICTRRT